MPNKARRGQRGHVKAAADNRGAPGVTKARARVHITEAASGFGHYSGPPSSKLNWHNQSFIIKFGTGGRPSAAKKGLLAR